ncbi:MAG: class I SAM-dependent methyltransferase [Solirubrobacteraceae bacterium]|nr:class I SAM-dependent methyltransferase [Solirubrobacteraceae bacterium]
MDWSVAPGTRIARLPRPLQVPAVLLREILPHRRPWTYDADGLATVHHSPFLEDEAFARSYDRMAADWFRDEVVDVRWRMWLLTRWARYARAVPGAYAEFGTYRGGCARMILATAELDPGRRFHLFDTYAGIPEARLTPAEREARFAGRLADTSAGDVRELLSPWDPVPNVVAGDVFDTFPATETGPIAFAHIDLNAAAPTEHVLVHVLERLAPGGAIVFDDYGWAGYEDQRARIDAVVAGRPEELIALPTGQAVLLRAPAAA